jgi:RNA polymerase primary sigma factor
MNVRDDDVRLTAMLCVGRERGFLTYSEINEYMPNESVTPEGLDHLLRVLEQNHIELRDEQESKELTLRADAARKRLRRKILESDYSLNLVLDILRRIHAGELPVEHAAGPWPTERLKNDEIAPMPQNLKMLEDLLLLNASDFNRGLDESLSPPNVRGSGAAPGFASAGQSTW